MLYFCKLPFPENRFLGTKEMSEIPITMSPQTPSQTEVEEALKMLYSDLASSTDRNVKQVQKKRVQINNMSGKDKKPSTSSMYPTPTPPPRGGRRYGKNVPPPPSDVSMKTRRVSSVRVPSRQESKGTSEDVRKTPQTRQRTPTPIPDKSSKQEKVSASKSRVASKSPSVPVPIVTHKLAVPPVPQRTKRDGQVSVVQDKVVPTKPRKDSSMNRDQTGSRPPVCKPRVPRKAKAGPKAEEPGPEKTRETRPTPPSDPEPEKKRIHPNATPEKNRAPKILQPHRARVKPVEDRTNGGIQGTAFSRPDSVVGGTNNSDHTSTLVPQRVRVKPVEDRSVRDTKSNHASTFPNTCPHFAHIVDIIRYRRMQNRSSSLGHSGPSVSSQHNYGI